MSLKEHMHVPEIFNLGEIRSDFPILSREIHPGVPLIYLDSAATSQKPDSVLQAMTEFYRRNNANIHRGVHTLAIEATELCEKARQDVADFIDAGRPQEIIFTRNTTESINLVMQTWARCQLKPGDRILLSEMEHHSNLVPWQILMQENGIQLDFIPISDTGEMDLLAYENLLRQEPKLVAITHVSNMLGTINPIGRMAIQAHEAGAKILVDGAQSVPHMPVSVRDLDADFFAFSAHKMCGPTGIGVLYGKTDILETMPPFLGGGDMIKRVEWRDFEPAELPHKFEAGTPAIAEAVGLAAAIRYLTALGMQNIRRHEQGLVTYADNRLEEISGLRIYGPDSEKKGGVVSFSLDGIHPHDVAQILDSEGIAVRAGHHCAMPLHTKLGLAATTRASFYLYNTPEEIDSLVEALWKVKRVFA